MSAIQTMYEGPQSSVRKAQNATKRRPLSAMSATRVCGGLAGMPWKLDHSRLECAASSWPLSGRSAVARALDVRAPVEVVGKVLERNAAAAHGGPGSHNASQPQTEWSQTRQRRYAPVDDVLPQLDDLVNAGRPGPVRRVEGAAEDASQRRLTTTTASLGTHW